MSYRLNKNQRSSSNSSTGKRRGNSNGLDYRSSKQVRGPKQSDFRNTRRAENGSNRKDFNLKRDTINYLGNRRGNNIKGIENEVRHEYSEKHNSRNYQNKPLKSNNYQEGLSLKKGDFNYRYQKNNQLNNYNHEYRNEIGSSSSSVSFSSSVPDDLLWGRHATEAALKSGRPIHRIWCTTELRSTSKFFQLLKDSKSSGVLIEEVSWSRLGQLTKGAVHQGIVLQIAATKTLELSKLIKACKPLGDSSILLALDGLTDPQNLGSIVRSAEALGAHGLVLPQRRSAGLTGSVAKVAAGALEHLPVARVVNLNRSLEQLKNNGYSVIGLAEEGDMTLPEVDSHGPLVVVTGSEAKGISLITRRVCDHLVRIPLRGVTTSLNASVATSIFLYEIARNRWMRTISGQAPSPRLVKPQFTSDIPNEKNNQD